MTDSPAITLAGAADLGDAPIDVNAVLQHLVGQADCTAATSIGFPGAVDLDYSEVMARMGRRLWNNIGDPATDPGGAAHTKVLERAVIAWVAETLAMPPDDRWGYVTTGGTEGNLAALHAAYRRHSTAIVYYSSAAHYSISKILGIIGAPGVVINARPDGEMDYEDLAAQVRRRRNRPAIVVATAGTTMTEAVDDTSRIGVALAEHAIDWHLHVDAALSGIPLALDGRLHLDNASGIGSIAISGHKFFGAPTPCGVVLIRDSLRRRGSHITYTATRDTTVTGSRCGLAATLLWHAIATHGREGHRWRVSEARHLAAYAVDQLTAVGWPTWRHPHAFTVVLKTPPATVREKWLLATDGDISHVICMPGISEGQINAFAADIATAADFASPISIPRPRTPIAPQTATALGFPLNGTVHRPTEAIHMAPHTGKHQDCRTGYVHHPLFFWHDTGTFAGLMRPNPLAGVQPGTHYEHPDTKRRIHELLAVAGLLDHLVPVVPRPATPRELERAHTRQHVKRIRSQSRQLTGGDAGDGFSPVGHGSYDIALLAAGGLMELVTAIDRGDITSGYALIRPPGHHATRDAGMGFCLFNNVAVAIRHAQVTTRMRRIAVLDWDVHHGNGTQDIFYDDPDVLTISLHQAGCFPPDSGWISENGEGEGAGHAINVPLPPGTGVQGYLYAMDHVVTPALDRFEPDMIVVSSGYDGSVLDPLGRQMLTASAYGEMTRRLKDSAVRLCDGRIAMAHEGGYSPDYAPFCGLAVIEALTGKPTTIVDPLADIVASWANEPLLPHQRAVIDEAAQLIPRISAPAPATTR